AAAAAGGGGGGFARTTGGGATPAGGGGRREAENNGRSRVTVSALNGTAQSGLPARGTGTGVTSDRRSRSSPGVRGTTCISGSSVSVGAADQAAGPASMAPPSTAPRPVRERLILFSCL